MNTNTFLVFLIFIPILVIILLLLNLLLAVHKPYTEKVEVYECGFHPVGEQTRSAFNVQFFLLALLFMVFDVELILFTPIVLSIKNVDSYGLIIAILFFLLLTLGFIFEIGKGALNIKNVLPLDSFNPFSALGYSKGQGITNKRQFSTLISKKGSLNYFSRFWFKTKRCLVLIFDICLLFYLSFLENVFYFPKLGLDRLYFLICILGHIYSFFRNKNINKLEFFYQGFRAIPLHWIQKLYILWCILMNLYCLTSYLFMIITSHLVLLLDSHTFIFIFFGNITSFLSYYDIYCSTIHFLINENWIIYFNQYFYLFDGNCDTNYVLTQSNGDVVGNLGPDSQNYILKMDDDGSGSLLTPPTTPPGGHAPLLPPTTAPIPGTLPSPTEESVSLPGSIPASVEAPIPLSEQLPSSSTSARVEDDNHGEGSSSSRSAWLEDDNHGEGPSSYPGSYNPQNHYNHYVRDVNFVLGIVDRDHGHTAFVTGDIHNITANENPRLLEGDLDITRSEIQPAGRDNVETPAVHQQFLGIPAIPRDPSTGPVITHPSSVHILFDRNNVYSNTQAVVDSELPGGSFIPEENRHLPTLAVQVTANLEPHANDMALYGPNTPDSIDEQELDTSIPPILPEDFPRTPESIHEPELESTEVLPNSDINSSSIPEGSVDRTEPSNFVEAIAQGANSTPSFENFSPIPEIDMNIPTIEGEGEGTQHTDIEEISDPILDNTETLENNSNSTNIENEENAIEFTGENHDNENTIKKNLEDYDDDDIYL